MIAFLTSSALRFLLLHLALLKHASVSLTVLACLLSTVLQCVMELVTVCRISSDERARQRRHCYLHRRQMHCISESLACTTAFAATDVQASQLTSSQAVIVVYACSLTGHRPAETCCNSVLRVERLFLSQTLTDHIASLLHVLQPQHTCPPANMP